MERRLNRPTTSQRGQKSTDFIKLEPVDESDMSYSQPSRPRHPVPPPSPRYDPVPPIHQCTLCVNPPLTFTTVPSMLAHYIDFHKVQPESYQRSESPHINAISDALKRGESHLIGVVYGQVGEPKIRVFGCALCPIKFKDPDSLIRHLDLHSKMVSEVSEKPSAEPTRISEPADNQSNIEIVSVHGSYTGEVTDSSSDVDRASNSSSPYSDKSWKPDGYIGESDYTETRSLRNRTKQTSANAPDSQMDHRISEIENCPSTSPKTALVQSFFPIKSSKKPREKPVQIKVEDESVAPDSTENVVETPVEKPDKDKSVETRQKTTSSVLGKSIIISKEVMDSRVRINGTYMWSCKRCHRMYTHKMDFITHLGTGHASMDGGIVVNDGILCRKCDAKFTDFKSLGMHLRTAHSGPGGSLSVEKKRMMERALKCDDCGVLLDGKKALLNHILAPGTSGLNCIAHTVNVERMKRFVTSSRGVNCTVCGLRMRNKYILYQHFKLNHDLFEVCDSNLRCGICDVRFTSLIRTVKHYQYEHSAPDEDIRRIFEEEDVSLSTTTCNICGVIIPNDASLIEHVLSQHGDKQQEQKLNKTEDKAQVKTYTRDVICRTQAIETLQKQKQEIAQEVSKKNKEEIERKIALKRRIEELEQDQAKRLRRSVRLDSVSMKNDERTESVESGNDAKHKSSEKGKNPMKKGEIEKSGTEVGTIKVKTETVQITQSETETEKTIAPNAIYRKGSEGTLRKNSGAEVGTVKVKTETVEITQSKTETEKTIAPGAVYRRGSERTLGIVATAQRETGTLRCAICNIHFTVLEMAQHYSQCHSNLIVLKNSTSGQTNQTREKPTVTMKMGDDKDDDQRDVFGPLCK